jgi:hypothetical protein
MNILFLFSLGSEVRQFYLSGVITGILDSGHDVTIASRHLPKELRDLLDERIKIEKMPLDHISGLYLILQQALDDSHPVKPVWRYMRKKVPVKGVKCWTKFFMLKLLLLLFRFSKIRELFVRIECWTQRFMSYPKWEKFFETNVIDRVVVNVPKVNLAGLYAAAKSKIPVRIAYHTNKDVFAFGRLNYEFDKYGVWNAVMKAELLHANPRIIDKDVSVIGCSHFSYLAKSYASVSQQEYWCDDFEVKKILFVASAPFAIENEHKYLFLIKDLLKKMCVEKYQIIVRVNPMDNTDYWEKKVCFGVDLSFPKWYWKNGFNFTLESDLECFSNLLKNADCVIGLPSTVILEAAIVNVPMINLVFSLPGVKSINGEIVDLWNAPFYKKVRDYGAAIPAMSASDLERALKDVLLSFSQQRHTNGKAYGLSEVSYDADKLSLKTSRFICDD